MSVRRVWAIGVSLVSFLAAFVLMAAGSPTGGCYPCSYPCPSAFDVGGYCLTPSGSNQPSACMVDGQPVTQCDPGSCPPWTLSSGNTLTIPVGTLWATLGPRDDLHWFIACLPPDDANLEASAPETSTPEASASVQDASTTDTSAFVSAVPEVPGTLTVLFDGSPATGCICTPNTEITCQRVPPTVQTIGFRYTQTPAPLLDGGPDGGADSGPDAGQTSVVLSIDFDVGDCLPSHTGCPHSDVPEGSAY